ncbi:MAG: cyclic nucleotide-binding domain-containing protein [Treponema sp.]|nr:cyclic nucleotide-binding domain-containing protein [Treponema sp.]
MGNQLQLTFVNFKKDSYIVVEGKQNVDRFFIIRSGKVIISKEVEVVAEEGGGVLGPGDFFGVVSTMSAHSHIETAKALTDVTLISVHKEQYGQLIQNNSPVAMKIILQFSKRLRYLDGALSQLTLKHQPKADADPSHLYFVGDYYLKQSKFNEAFYAYHQYLKYCPQGEHTAEVKEKMMKISPYVKGVVFDHSSVVFTRTYPNETMIFSEGEPGDELYIIQRGSVKIVRIMDGKEVLIAVLKAGDIFGEMALLESKPRAASAVAYSDCTVMAVNKVNFERMITTQPQIISRLTTLLSERIWLVYKQLANTLINDPIGRMYDVLLIQLEKNRIGLIPKTSYTFDFGPKELANMIGIPTKEMQFIMSKILENNKIRIENDKMQILDVIEIVKQSEYYHKMQRIENTRRENTVLKQIHIR